MWFSGLRGAIAYALSLHLEFKEETRMVLVTTTLVVVLFTTIGLGGGTMPFMKYLESKKPRRNRRGRKKEITLSKTRELGATIDSEQLSELTEEEIESSTTFNVGSRRVKGFLYFDLKYIRPFLTRKYDRLYNRLRRCVKLASFQIHPSRTEGRPESGNAAHGQVGSGRPRIASSSDRFRRGVQSGTGLRSLNPYNSVIS
jgi:hypothetical protein